MPLVSLKELKERLPKGQRLMGIDHSPGAWGLALADPSLKIVTPFKTIRRTKFAADVKALADLCREWEVGGLVIGLPLNMDGTKGPRAESVTHFAENILKAKDVFRFDPLVTLYDERLSTHAADTALAEDLDMSREKRREIIDAHAAALILKAALDENLLT